MDGESMGESVVGKTVVVNLWRNFVVELMRRGGK